MRRRALFRRGRSVHCPRGVCSPGVVDEEDPPTAWEAAHDLHPVVMDFNRVAVLIDAGDAPLRAAKRELSRHGCMVHDNVHVRFQPDVARHGLLNPRGAVRHRRCAMDLVQSDHTRVGMIHRGRSLDVMRVESFGKPEVNEFW